MGRPKRYIKLSNSEKELLRAGNKSGKKATYRQRCHYILLSAQGKSIDEIAEIYELNRVSITKWFDRYESQGLGGLHTAQGRGRPPIVRIDNISEVEKIEKWVKDSPQNLKPVLAKIKKELGKPMGHRSLVRLLKKKMDVETFS